MTGVELLAGAAVGYLVRKLRRVGGRADAEVDRALDAGMDGVHDLLSTKLGQDRAVEALQAQAESPGSELSERTVRRVVDVVADEIEADPEFARQLRLLVEELQRCERGIDGQVNTSQERSAAIGVDTTGIVSSGDRTVNTQQQSTGYGQVYQAGGSQRIQNITASGPGTSAYGAMSGDVVHHDYSGMNKPATPAAQRDEPESRK
ncbi:hypothetical protein PO587_38925 [Streptomyces gilvifuscus]|uniref:Chromosome partitioning protein n=1 Tax=Streptomyces gilvifuscus TaxID=1550617 RepID=A0ABT5G6E9_9ACTN|nr:hypothetical protein [Streptomyces gilvifuscus]MDC2960414.1 hypothetical protein [Streptomyces gilvifuscus]